jgi:16S rRNA (guanine527-N7)-methyltransferase
VTAGFDRQPAGVVTRDLEPIAATLERALGFLPPGGRAIFMKGPAVDQEIDALDKGLFKEYRLARDQAYTLGDTGLQRRLVVFERAAHAKPTASAGEPRFQEIASRSNDKFKAWRKLLDGPSARKQGQALVSGLKAAAETLRDYPQVCDCLLGRDDRDPEVPSPSTVKRFRLRPELFRELDVFGAGPPLLVVNAPTPPPLGEEPWPPGATLFLPFQDPANVGAALRSAAAFGAAQAVLLKEAAHPFHPKSLRAAGPPVFGLNLKTGPSIRDLSESRWPLYALHPQGLDITRFTFPETFGLIPGVEGPGLPDHLKQGTLLSIPMAEGVESLNAAAASAVALYQWRLGRPLKQAP